MASIDLNTVEPVAEMVRDFWRPRAAAAAVQLGVPDVMGDRTMTSAEIAAQIGAHPHAVLRLLRALASIGLCDHRGGSEFALSAKGQLLRSNVPGSVFGHAFHVGNVVWGMFENFDDVVRSGGRSGADDAGFAELAADPAKLAAFHTSMADQSLEVARDLMKVYDFLQYRTVVDVGGGYGGMLRGLLERHPSMTGAVFDLPQMGEPARRYLAEAGLSDRAQFVAGDFFTEVPAGAEAYVLKYIMHDWDDEAAVRILKSCRKAAGANGAVLVVENVVPERIEDSPAHRAVIGLDLVMMSYGGMERTVKEYSDLFARAGLTLIQVTPGPNTGFCVVEGIAAHSGPETAPEGDVEVEAEKSDREPA